MTDRLKINGWMVAEADLEHGYHPYGGVDRVSVFRNPAGRSTLTIARDVRYDDYDRPISGIATVTTSEYATLDELAENVDKGYRAGAWVQLLDAGHENDPDLYAAWVPEQMRRDLDRSSIWSDVERWFQDGQGRGVRGGVRRRRCGGDGRRGSGGGRGWRSG